MIGWFQSGLFVEDWRTSNPKNGFYIYMYIYIYGERERARERDRDRDRDRETETEYNKSPSMSWFENVCSKLLPIVGLFQGLLVRLD